MTLARISLILVFSLSSLAQADPARFSWNGGHCYEYSPTGDPVREMPNLDMCNGLTPTVYANFGWNGEHCYEYTRNGDPKQKMPTNDLCANLPKPNYKTIVPRDPLAEKAKRCSDVAQRKSTQQECLAVIHDPNVTIGRIQSCRPFEGEVLITCFKSIKNIYVTPDRISACSSVASKVRTQIGCLEFARARLATAERIRSCQSFEGDALLACLESISIGPAATAERIRSCGNFKGKAQVACFKSVSAPAQVGQSNISSEEAADVVKDNPSPEVEQNKSVTVELKE